MSNIVITSDETYLYVATGDYFEKIGIKNIKAVKNITSVYNLGSCVSITVNQGTHLLVHEYNEEVTRAFVVDSIDGVALTSNDDLYDKLTSLM